MRNISQIGKHFRVTDTQVCRRVIPSQRVAISKVKISMQMLNTMLDPISYSAVTKDKVIRVRCIARGRGNKVVIPPVANVPGL